MNESRHHSEREEPFQPGMFTRGLGYVCVVIGIGMGVWLFFKVWGFIEEPALFQQFQQLITESLEAAVNTADGDVKVLIPFEPIGYLLLVIFIGIMIRIAGMFLGHGAKLLSRDSDTYLKKMSKTQDQMNTKIDKIQTGSNNGNVYVNRDAI